MFAWLKKLAGGPALPEPAPPPATAEEALARWRRASRPSEQVTALEGLASVGGAEGRAVIESVLRTGASAHARIAAARLLGEGGGPGAAFRLSEAAKADADPLVRTACENALARLGKSAGGPPPASPPDI